MMKKIIRIVASGLIGYLMCLLLLQLAISNEPAKAGPLEVNGSSSLCSTPDKLINGSDTITDTIMPTFEGNIEDLDVYLDISHNRIGNLVISLENSSTLPIFIINQPNGTLGTCNGQNISNFADDSPIGLFNDSCQDADPAYPRNERYQPLTLLNNFFGDPINETWKLTITDIGGVGEQGRLKQWCLLPKLETVYTPVWGSFP